VDSTYVDPHGNFSRGQVAAIQMVFTDCIRRDMAPIVFFAIAPNGVPCAIFNGAFSQADADSIGEMILSQLEVIQENLQE
jgi:hypothetical protein